MKKTSQMIMPCRPCGTPLVSRAGHGAQKVMGHSSALLRAWPGRPTTLCSGRSTALTVQRRGRTLRPFRRWTATSSQGASVPPPPTGFKLHQTGSLIGSAMGFFGGLVGQGGGVVGIPMMTSLARLTQHQAHGTSLVAVASTGLAGALAYWQAGGAEEGVDTLAALMLAGSASLFATLGAKSSKRVSSPNLSRYMGLFMVAASVSVAIKACIDYPATHPHGKGPLATVTTITSTTADATPVLSFGEKAAQLTPARIATIGAIGAVTGFASGFLGIGGGLVMVPLLTLFTTMHQSQVLGTSLLAMVIPSMVGSWTHLRLGNVFTPLLPSMVTGTLAGAYLGGKVSTNLTQTQQRTVVAVTIFALALRMLRKK